MNLNVRFISRFLLTLIVIVGVNSCDKFKDDISAKSYSEVSKDVSGDWHLVAVSRNGTDITDYMDFTRFHIILNEDGTYELKNYLPFIVKNNGTWSVDDPLYPFHLTFKVDTETEMTTEIGFITVNGLRRLTITLSPGCSSNEYIYTFEHVVE